MTVVVVAPAIVVVVVVVGGASAPTVIRTALPLTAPEPAMGV